MTTSILDSAPVAGTVEAAHKARKDPGTHTKNTLFLRGLPATCTSSDLETFFSEWGPVRSAFPVTKGASFETETGATAIGFVHFALAEDAQRALTALQAGSLPFMGRPITGELALRKRRESRTVEGPKDSKPRERKDRVNNDKAQSTVGTGDGSKEGGKKRKRADVSGTSVTKETTVKTARPQVGPELKRTRLHGSDNSSSLVISITAPESLTMKTPQFDKKQLYKRLRKCGDLIEVTFPLENSHARACLRFSSAAAAQEAITKIDQHIFKGHRLLVEPAERAETTASTASAPAIKAHRLIIRNLPWGASEEALRQELTPFGTLLEVTLPKGIRGTSRGFAFVQFAERSQAEAAMARLNGKLLLGRPVALDFALSKSHYLRAEQGSEMELESTSASASTSISTEPRMATYKDPDDAFDVEMVDVEGTSDVEDEPKAKIKTKAKANIKHQDQDGDSGEDEDEDVDIENVTEDEEQVKKPSFPSLKGEDKVEEDEETEEEEEEEEEEGTEEESTSLQKTVFIRNVPFTTEEEELTDLLTERFGPVIYCKVVRDPQTGAARGTAFAKFVSVQAARLAISESAKLTQNQLDATQREESSPLGGEKEVHRLDDKLATLAQKRTGKTFKSVINDNSITVVDPALLVASSSSAPAGLVLGGRALSIIPAVDKGRAKELRSHPFLDAGPQDRRNLHLLGETLLKPKTLAAKRFWPPVDISYREQAVRERRKELKANHNLFVSRTRLSLRHLPLATDEKIIRKVLYAAVHRARAHPEGPIVDLTIFPLTGKPLLKQVKVIRDSQRQRSKGYAFAEFVEPGDALTAVRYLANWEPGLWRELGGEAFSHSNATRHKKASTGSFRAKAPLVEFATEKRAVLERRQARLKEETTTSEGKQT